jgi:hypothetical protein
MAKKKAAPKKPELMDSVKAFEDMGLKVISKKRGFIPEQQQSAILDELGRIELFHCYKRLYELDLERDQLDDAALKFDVDGKRRGEEVEALRRSFMAIDNIRHNLKKGSISALFSDAVFLGESLLRGNSRHPGDIETDRYDTRVLTGSSRDDLKGFEKMREMSICKASQLWKGNDELLLKDVSSQVLEEIKTHYGRKKIKLPAVSTIRKWLKEAASDKTNDFTLPGYASRRGRRPVKK